MITEEGKVKEVTSTPRAIFMGHLEKKAAERGMEKIVRVRSNSHRDCGQKFLYKKTISDMGANSNFTAASWYYGHAYQCNHGLDYSINRVGDLFLSACELALTVDDSHAIYVTVFVRFESDACNRNKTTPEKAQADHDKATKALKQRTAVFGCIAPPNLKFDIIFE